MSFSNGWKHFKTITYHKFLVARHCFKVGLYRQGIVHDLSKYSPVEFRTGARYFQGNRSPNTEERAQRGYSPAWLHHKGRNKHHFEYWIDMVGNGDARLEGKQMPTRYVVEMFCDRVAASKVYQGDKYRCDSPLNYYRLEQGTGKMLMHPETHKLLDYMLVLLAEQGEDEAFRIIRETIVKPRYTSGERGEF